MICIVCWVSSCLSLIPISLSDCRMIRGKKKIHLNKLHSQINHRIPNVTLLNSQLTRFFIANQHHFLKSKTEYAETRYNCKTPTTEKAALPTSYGL